MFLGIPQHTFFTCVCITVYTEMTASVIHSNIFAHHASTNFSLPSILNLPFFLWDRWKITKHISFRPFKGMKIVNQFFVISKNTFQYNDYAQCRRIQDQYLQHTSPFQHPNLGHAMLLEFS